MIPLRGLADYEGAVEVYRTCRRTRLTVWRRVDCLIATVPINTRAPLLHADSDFELIVHWIALRLIGPGACAVPDMQGTGGEFQVSGIATMVEDEPLRAIAVSSARYTPAERYILFELCVTEARCNGYGDVTMPSPPRWRAVN